MWVMTGLGKISCNSNHSPYERYLNATPQNWGSETEHRLSFVAFFCRGSEGQRELKKLRFKFEADASWGRFYHYGVQQRKQNSQRRCLWCPEEKEGYQSHEVLPSKPKFRQWCISVSQEKVRLWWKSLHNFSNFKFLFNKNVYYHLSCHEWVAPHSTVYLTF